MPAGMITALCRATYPPGPAFIIFHRVKRKKKDRSLGPKETAGLRGGCWNASAITFEPIRWFTELYRRPVGLAFLRVIRNTAPNLLFSLPQLFCLLISSKIFRACTILSIRLGSPRI